MRIMLVHPAVTGEDNYGKLAKAGSYWPPLGLCYIASVLEKRGDSVKIIDGLCENITQEEVVRRIEDYNPDVMGITTVTITHDKTINLARMVRSKLPKVKIIVGGPHVTCDPTGTMKEESFDFGVYGEGERTVPELFDAIEKNKPMNGIKGILYRNNGKVVMTSPREFIGDLDEIPFPARHLLKKGIYHNEIMAHRRKPVAHMMTSRGCPYSCIFCNSGMFGKKYRKRSPENVIAEVDELVNKYGIREIEFKDDNFLLDKERMKKICWLLIEKKYDLIWSCDVRADQVNEEIMGLMKKAGCWLIQMGIETGDENVMKAIKKGITIQQVKDAVRIARKYGIQVKGFFMIGQHVDTKGTIEKTINFAHSLPLYKASFALVMPLYGTELGRIAKDYGTVDPNHRKFSPHKDEVPFVPHGLTKEYLLDARRRAYLKFYGNPKYIWRLIKDIKTPYDIKRYLIGLSLFLNLRKRKLSKSS